METRQLSPEEQSEFLRHYAIQVGYHHGIRERSRPGFRGRKSLPPTLEIAHDDLLYIAAFFDAEGAFSCYWTEARGALALQLAFNQASRSILDWISSLVGGNVYSLRPSGYRLIVNGDEAESLLKTMIPFMKVRQEEAFDLLAIRLCRHHRAVTDYLLSRRSHKTYTRGIWNEEGR